MLDKIKKIYPSLNTYDQHHTHDKNYNWFTRNQNIIFGIHQKELEAKDKQLLEMFFHTYNTSLPLETPTEKLWLERVRGNDETQRSEERRVGKESRYQWERERRRETS